jgi:hypothetical protein
MTNRTKWLPHHRKFLLTPPPEMWTAGKVDRRDEKAAVMR